MTSSPHKLVAKIELLVKEAVDLGGTPIGVRLNQLDIVNYRRETGYYSRMVLSNIILAIHVHPDPWAPPGWVEIIVNWGVRRNWLEEVIDEKQG